MPVARTAPARSRETTMRVPSRPAFLQRTESFMSRRHVESGDFTRVGLSPRLERVFAERSRTRVSAMTVLAQRLDRRGLVDHARVVEQQHRPRFGQGEACPTARRPRTPGFRRPYALAPDQDHGDEIHVAVAVRALRRGPAEPVAGIDPELVRLDALRRCQA